MHSFRYSARRVHRAGPPVALGLAAGLALAATGPAVGAAEPPPALEPPAAPRAASTLLLPGALAGDPGGPPIRVLTIVDAPDGAGLGLVIFGAEGEGLPAAARRGPR